MIDSSTKKGLTLIESAISIALVAILLVGILGAFYISKTSSVRAKHRMVAMNIVREYLEKETSMGYYGGTYGTITAQTTVTIDDRGTSADTADDLLGIVEPYPNTVGNITEGTYGLCKIIGFRVSWNEPLYGAGGSVACNERAVTFIESTH